jgi:hypothetical protein
MLPFIVRCWPMDSSKDNYEAEIDDLDEAIDLARSKAGQAQLYRRTEVMDQRNLIWASFGALWDRR